MLYNLKNVVRSFGERVVLDIPDLELQAGKIYTLIGPNGAGKTTLLHLLAFLDKATSGQLYFYGMEVGFDSQSLMDLRRKVVLVDQYPILFTAPVWKNLDFGLKIRKVPEEERRLRIEEALELVGMQDFYNRDADTLSGGETKRIALARALVLKPEVLLCDEPTANVDAKHQEIILNILEKSNRESHLSIIFATHYLSQAQRLAHHSLILQNGRLSNEARENEYDAQRFCQGEVFAVYRLSKEFQLKIPKKPNRELPLHGSIYIDPKSLIIEAGDQRQPGENCFSAVVSKMAKENGHIRIVVDAGVSLQITIPPDRYKANPFWIGEVVTVTIPDQAITLKE